MIQEEILRCAEEAQRREQDDEVSADPFSQVCINLLWSRQEMISSQGIDRSHKKRLKLSAY